MKLSTLIQTSLLAIGLPLVLPAWASTTYSYTDTQDSTFSGSFSVASALADGQYSFLLPVNQPAGFNANFFTTPFVDGQGVTRTPSLSLFNVTISSGAVALWDIRASTLFTFVTYSGGKSYTKVYHQNATLIYHDTNVSYLPGNGGAYQSAITQGDYKTYYAYQFAYQETLTGVYHSPGTWSIASATPPVPEPETYAMLLAGLGAVVFMTRRR